MAPLFSVVYNSPAVWMTARCGNSYWKQFSSGRLCLCLLGEASHRKDQPFRICWRFVCCSSLSCFVVIVVDELMLFHPHTCWWLKITDTCVRKTNNAADENLAVVVLANSGKTPEIIKFFPSNKCVRTNCTLFFHVRVSWFLDVRYVVLAPVAFLLMTPPCWNSPPCSWCVCTCTSADTHPRT